MPTLLTVGQRLPELRVLTALGVPTSVGAHLGSPATLLNFLHGTWCPDCVSQLYRLQRRRRELTAAGVEAVMLVRDKPETLAAFLLSARPSLEYTVLTDPRRLAYQAIGAGGDTVAIIADRQGVVRWFTRWPEHREEPGYETFLQALREV